MYSFRTSLGPVDLAFTDRYGGVSGVPFDSLNLALEGDDDPAACALNLTRVLDDFAPGDELRDLRQVHGAEVVLVDDAPPCGSAGAAGSADSARPTAPPDADALVTARTGVVLLVRAADCVPVLLADPSAGVVAAVHSGRPGLAARVVPAAVARMRELGARDVTAWIGPHVCGACYEVPAALQREVADMVPASLATTSWGTPSLDLGAGVRSQLEADGVRVVDVSRCTRESPDLFSYRRDGRGAGRLAGLIRVRAR